ncbi:mechanosensitive ion channel family protein [Lewinella sp. IMCC34183]|uniref:mechanosensitive ion channel family protein n=1 Tax=Lewinella sp. IMCC34183 TaxID=2248762 RepID=UPI000E25E500|nr:mechanosensitive ion channel domain-containing protein [Lewinella sp. IMCC34183]
MDSALEMLRLQIYQMLTIIPSLIVAIVLLLIGYIAAKVLYQVVRRLVAAAGLDRLSERLRRTEPFRGTQWSIVPSRLLAGFVYYFVLIVFTMAAVHALGMDMLSALIAELVAYLPHAIAALLILLGGLFLADFVRRIVVATCRSLGITAENLIGNAVFYFILLNIILIALRQAELQTEFMENNVSILLAGLAGAFAIGYGLASRHIMSNILASFYNRNQIRVGDEISIAGKRGEVVQLNNLSITLRSEDSEFTVPFSKLSSEGFEMHSRRASGPALPPHLGR